MVEKVDDCGYINGCSQSTSTLLTVNCDPFLRVFTFRQLYSFAQVPRTLFVKSALRRRHRSTRQCLLSILFELPLLGSFGDFLRFEC